MKIIIIHKKKLKSLCPKQGETVTQFHIGTKTISDAKTITVGSLSSAINSKQYYGRTTMPVKENDNPSKQQIWETLSKVNVNEHTESKMNLTYLSWAWAWKILKDNYPNASYSFTEFGESSLDYRKYEDGTGSVECSIQIGAECCESMWLPIMDNRNNAIQNPNARQVSDAKMRCLVKCISMLGLGLYIYAGEDIPEEAAVAEPKTKPKPKPKTKTKPKTSKKS